MLLGALRRRAVTHKPAPPESSGKSAGEIAKWFIPSVGVFVALIGFAAETAHQDLLGIDRGDLGATAYVWSAGQFVRSVIRSVASTLFRPEFRAAHSHDEIWLLAGVLAVCAVVYSIKRRVAADGRPPLWRRTLFTGILLMLVAWRFLIVEIPLARIESLLVGGPRAIVETLRYEESAQPERLILMRATEFYSLLLCQRDSNAKVAELQLACQKDRDYAIDAVRLMLVIVGVSACMLWLIALLWPGASSATAVVVLFPCAVYCSVAPAYLYGKLVKPPTFDFALIQLRTRLEKMPEQTALRTSNVSSVDPANGRLLFGIILGRDDKLVSLYVDQHRQCASGPSTYEWVPWQLPLSEVIAVREIVAVDVISERFKQVPCPDSPPPR
jgi:hypothetical protein